MIAHLNTLIPQLKYLLEFTENYRLDQRGLDLRPGIDNRH